MSRRKKPGARIDTRIQKNNTLPYRARLTAFTPPPPCKQDCAACEGGRHREFAQKAARRRGEAGFKTAELGRIPRLLVEDIYSSVMALGLKT